MYRVCLSGSAPVPPYRPLRSWALQPRSAVRRLCQAGLLAEAAQALKGCGSQRSAPTVCCCDWIFRSFFAKERRIVEASAASRVTCHVSTSQYTDYRYHCQTEWNEKNFSADVKGERSPLTISMTSCNAAAPILRAPTCILRVCISYLPLPSVCCFRSVNRQLYRTFATDTSVWTDVKWDVEEDLIASQLDCERQGKDGDALPDPDQRHPRHCPSLPLFYSSSEPFPTPLIAIVGSAPHVGALN